MNLFPGQADSGVAGELYNYSKFALSLSWQSNLLGVVHGDFLQKQQAELTRQVETLHGEIAVRQQRIASLELEIQRYEAQNLLELEQRRAAAEQALRQEKDALRALEERLQKLEQNAPPTTPAKPPQG
jgi:septal ring factor EnvC (AmiA/AmiB activator)